VHQHVERHFGSDVECQFGDYVIYNVFGSLWTVARRKTLHSGPLWTRISYLRVSCKHVITV